MRNQRPYSWRRPALSALLAAFLCVSATAQNLVPNEGFEQFSGCPWGTSQIDSCLYWINPSTNQSNSGSPDYYNQCAPALTVGVPSNWAGYQDAHNGVAYGGLYLYIGGVSDAREYLEVPLTTPLSAGVSYDVQFYVSLSDRSRYTAYAIGAYFSMSAVTGVNNYYPLPYTPQVQNSAGNAFDTLAWTKVNGTFTAAGGETHLIVGNFGNDASTWVGSYNPSASFDHVYAYVDDVSVHVTGTSHAGSPASPLEATLVEVSAGGMSLALSGTGTGMISVALVDGAGRLIRQQQVCKRANVVRTRIDLHGVRPGVYAVEARMTGGAAVKKVVVY